MSDAYPRPQHLPPLPVLPSGHVWSSRASADEAFTALSQGYDRASQLLRLEDGDPIRLRLHAEQITQRCFPIFDALCRELPQPDGEPWMAVCRQAFHVLVRELNDAAEAASNPEYVIELAWTHSTN